MDLDELTDACRAYLREQPTENGRRGSWDDWPNRVDQLLADLRAELYNPAGARPLPLSEMEGTR